MDGTLRAQLGPARAVRPTSLVSIASTSSGGSEFATAPPLESDRSPFDSNGFPFPRSPTSGTFPVLYEEEEPSAPVPAVLNPRHALMRLRRTSLPLNTAQTSRSVVGGSASPIFLSKGKNRMSVASLSSVGSFESLPEEEDECDQEVGRSGMEPSQPPHRTQPPFAADGRPVLARLATFPADNAFPAPGGRPPVVPRSSAPAAIPYHGGYQAFAIPRGASGSAVRSPLSRRNSVGPATLDDDDLRGALLGERLERGRVRTKSAEGGTPEDAARREDRRWRIALELRETERAYCEVLEDIDKHYYQPLLGALPISPLASRRASRHSTPTSPTISPISLPSSPVFGPLKRMSAYMPTSPLSPVTDWTATPQILARREIGEIFANFPNVVSLSRVMLETLEATVPDRPSDPLPVSPPAQDRSPFGHAPELSSSTDTLESDGPGTPREGDAGATSSAEQSPEPRLNGVNAPPLRLGKSLLPILPFLRSYSFFISNFSAALSRLSSLESPASMHGASTASPSPTEDRIKWQRFMEERRRSGVGRGLGLSSLLLNIVQRIPRYRMLLADLVKYTEPEHVDYRDLCTAFQVVEGVANFLENEIQAHTNVLQILDLQRSLLNLDAPLVLPGRRLIKIGQLVKLDRRGNQQNRTFFLLNDLLLYAAGDESWSIGIGLGFGDIGGERSSSPSRRGHAGTDGAGSGPWAGLTAGGVAGGAVGTGLRFCRKAGIYDVTVVSVEDGLEGGRKFGFEILTSEKSFSVYASSYEEKQDWIDAIRNAKSDFLRDRRTLLKDGESTLRRARRERQTSLLVTPSALRPNPTTPPRGPRFGVIPPTPSEEIEALVLDAPLETLTDEGDDAPIPFPTSPLPPASLAPTSSTTPPRPNLRLRRWSDMSISAAASVLSPTVSSQAGSLDLAPLVQVRVIENYHAPVFVPDSRVARCSRCSEPFGFWRRRHHCRICGGVVCWACSTKTFIIPSDNEATPNRLARACDPCYQSSFSVPALGHVALVVATADLFPATEQLAASLAEGAQGEGDAAAAPAGSGAQGGTGRADRRLSARDQLSLLLGRLG